MPEGQNEAAGWSGRYVGRLSEAASRPERPAHHDGCRSASTLFPSHVPTEPERSDMADEPGEGGRRWAPKLALVAVMAVLMAGAGFCSGAKLLEGQNETTESSHGDKDQESELGAEIASGQDLDQDSQTARSAAAERGALDSFSGAGLLLNLNPDLSFSAVGTVSDQGSADAIAAAVAATFGARARVDITVDPDLAQPPWLPSATRAVALIPLLIYGLVEITEQQTLVVGRGFGADFDSLAEGLGPELGFAPLLIQADVVEGREPWVRAVSSDGRLSITGQVPDEDLGQALRSGATRSYGEEMVRDLIEVDDRTFARSALLRFAQYLGELSVFDDYVLGLEGNRLYGRFEQGLSFETSDSGLGNQNRRRLNALLPILVGSNTPVTIVGHTDRVEADEGRSELGRSRGQRIADYLTGAGVEAELLTIEDRGDADPAASNRSAEGRASNRRVEIVIGRDG